MLEAAEEPVSAPITNRRLEYLAAVDRPAHDDGARPHGVDCDAERSRGGRVELLAHGPGGSRRCPQAFAGLFGDGLLETKARLRGASARVPAVADNGPAIDSAA